MMSAEVQERGFPLDRRWMLVDTTGRFVSQREAPRLSLIQLNIVKNGIQVSNPNGTKLFIPVETPEPEDREVSIWDNDVRAIDCGDPAAEWFSRHLAQDVRLVHMTRDVVRRRKPSAGSVEFELSFADGYPYLLTNTASLADLNDRLDEPIPMDRFRANLVVDAGEPFIEDHWKVLQIGEVLFDVVKPCARCTITTIDQESGLKGQEPLRTLSGYRRFGNKVLFGMNLVARNIGTISTGGPVLIIE